MIQILFLIFLCILTFIAWRYLYPRHSSKYPPIPGRPYPLIGHLPDLMAQKPIHVFRNWMQKTNGTCSVYLGSKLFILTSDYELMKEMFIKRADVFCERGETFSLVLDFDENHRGLAGMHWRDHRTVSLSIMRTLGIGREVMNGIITDELDSVLKTLSKQKGTPMDVEFLMIGSMSNILFSMLLGERFSLQDKKFTDLIDLMHQQEKLISELFVLDVFPWLKYIPGDPFKTKKYKRNFDTIMQMFRDHIGRCRDGTDEQSYVNFIKTYMTEQDLESITYFLLVGGIGTTARATLWALLLAINHPDTQRKSPTLNLRKEIFSHCVDRKRFLLMNVNKQHSDLGSAFSTKVISTGVANKYQIYEEIKEFIGLNRQPSFEDRKAMHYTNAFISESQRYRALATTTLPRLCERTTQLGGYTIPEGAFILPFLDQLAHDKKVWGDPDVFRPERFLSEEGNFVVPEYHIPFFLGKRMCLGDTVAKMELFLFVTSIFQRFSLLPEDPDNLPSLHCNYNIGCHPDPFTVRFVERA